MERFYDRLISTMGFPVLVRRHLYFEPGPRIFAATVHSCTVSIYMVRNPIQIQIWNSRFVLTYVMDESVTGVDMKASYIWYHIAETLGSAIIDRGGSRISSSGWVWVWLWVCGCGAQRPPLPYWKERGGGDIFKISFKCDYHSILVYSNTILQIRFL